MHAADARFIGEHDAQMPLASRCRSNCVVEQRSAPSSPNTRAIEYRLYCPFLNALISNVCMPPRGERLQRGSRERNTQM
jgi:hypothetical protein